MTSQGSRASHVILEREQCFNERVYAKSRGNRTRVNSLGNSREYSGQAQNGGGGN